MKSVFIYFYLIAISMSGLAQIKPDQSEALYSQTVRTIPSAYSDTVLVNSIRTWIPSMPTADPDKLILPSRKNSEVAQSTQYMDGLGRLLQTVLKKGALGDRDIVSPVVYDALGRMTLNYLPYASDSGNGSFKQDPFNEQSAFLTGYYNPLNETNGERFFYSRTEYEKSPLSRQVNGFAPGNSWVGSNRSIFMEYKFNTGSEVRIWNIDTIESSIPISSGYYAAGSLYKNIVINEHGNVVIEYKDKSGQIILKKVQLTGTDNKSHSGWLCTYYIYDELNAVRFVIPPKAVDYISGHSWDLSHDPTVISELCFQYSYDHRHRMRIKKVPGAGTVSMVYDALNRLVMVRDTFLATKGQWLVTNYDIFSRPVTTTLWTNNSSRAFHEAAAKTSSSYPVLSGTYETLSETYYDNYSWISSSGSGLSSTFTASDTIASGFLQPSDKLAPYPRALTPTYNVRDAVTGSRTKILGTSNYLYSALFYDEKGRVIQIQNKNQTGGIDRITTQYSFDGRVLVSNLNHNATSLVPSNIVTKTYNHFDEVGRLVRVDKRVNSDSLVAVVRNSFDTMGRLALKQLGQQKNGSEYDSIPIESLQFDYNIRGWLTGINKEYIANYAFNTTNYFAEQLSYDHGFSEKHYNGNISGATWISRTDNQLRSYGYNYDASSRLMRADFTEYDGLSWSAGQVNDFTSIMGDGVNPAIAYDVNGNILRMTQKGAKLGEAVTVDSLLYTYLPNSNKLKNVWDRVNDTATHLGDFRSSKAYMTALSGSKDSTATDYFYDGNGNMIGDLNKDIADASVDGIEYNHLKLPVKIYVNNMGIIEYLYDAAGNKLEKTVKETGKADKVTKYINGMVYLQDTLQLLGHEEGRIRYAKRYFVNGDSSWQYIYDYFITDHLGNIRMVLTEQKDTSHYIATMETVYRATEEQLFSNISETAEAVSNVPFYPTGEIPSSGDIVSKLNGSSGSGNKKIGPSLVLKVMSGDEIDIAVQAFYQSRFGTTTNANPVNDILASLASGLTGIAGASKGSIADLSNTTTSPLLGAISLFRPFKNPSVPDAPKAYLNWILLDEQLQYVSGSNQSGAHHVGDPDQINPLTEAGISIKSSGYLYIYVSNETEDWNVFFDNLSVTHRTGAVLESTHYYPFGLTMAGIGSKSSGKLESKYKYNSKELQSKEFSDISGLELYDYHARMQDPQLGRWHTPDPHADSYLNQSPYDYVFNHPINATDPTGMDTHLQGDAAREMFQSMMDNGYRNIGFLDALAQRYMDHYGVESNFIIKAILPVFQSIIPQTYQHIVDAQRQGYSPILTRGNPKLTDKTRGQAYKDKPFMEKNPGTPEFPYWSDEYPFASTVEGGLGASLRYVPKWEQVIQANQISSLYNYVKPGEKFFVLPISSDNYPYDTGPAYYKLPDGNPSTKRITRPHAPPTELPEIQGPIYIPIPLPIFGPLRALSPILRF